MQYNNNTLIIIKTKEKTNALLFENKWPKNKNSISIILTRWKHYYNYIKENMSKNYTFASVTDGSDERLIACPSVRRSVACKR